jgi:cytochrome c biogenesis protein CcdA/thiol-disulfide isomerase/thioredoxin
LKRKTFFKIIAIVALLAAGFWQSASARAAWPAQEPTDVPIYFFWGDGCPHCEDEKPFLEKLVRANRRLVLYDYEVWYVQKNQDLMRQMTAALGFEPGGVPVTIVGDRYWIGYSEAMGTEIAAHVDYCLEEGCPDVGVGIVPGRVAQTDVVPENPGAETPTSRVINIPLIGEVNLEAQSLFASTALIAFVDGFNPCSLWVLSILLSLTLNTGSRKKVFIIGAVFITVTAAVYMLFIAGLFTFLSFVSFLGWIQGVIALLALFFALINIKDYFWYKEGLSFTIADDKKSGIYKGIRKVMQAGDSLWGLVSATFVMALGVSLVEFSCTAGFPVLWTNLVMAQQVEPLTFVLLLLLYMVIYQIDEAIIFLAAVFTLKASRLEEKHGRVLKLIGGMLMLTLAGVMLIDPDLMDNLSSSLLIFGVAFVAAMAVLLVHRKVLPHYGIYIGSEVGARKGRRASNKHTSRSQSSRNRKRRK